MNNEIKISNELLGFVFGCECEFESTNHVNIYFKPVDAEKFWEHELFDEWIISQDDATYFKINLHTFIHLAEKKFISTHLLSPVLDGIIVFCIYSGEALNQFGEQLTPTMYKIEDKLEALEWIQKEVCNEK